MTIKEAAQVGAVLGSRSRIEIFRLLLQSGPAGLIVSQLRKTFDIPGPTLSHHLLRLRNAGLVTIRRQGTFLWYLPVPDRARAFAELLLGLSGGHAPAAPVETVPSRAVPPDVEIEVD